MTHTHTSSLPSRYELLLRALGNRLVTSSPSAPEADVKLIDFGLAASDPAPGQEKAILAFAGTPSYMAPEVRARAGAPGSREQSADVSISR